MQMSLDQKKKLDETLSRYYFGNSKTLNMNYKIAFYPNLDKKHQRLIGFGSFINKILDEKNEPFTKRLNTLSNVLERIENNTKDEIVITIRRRQKFRLVSK